MDNPHPDILSSVLRNVQKPHQKMNLLRAYFPTSKDPVRSARHIGVNVGQFDNDAANRIKRRWKFEKTRVKESAQGYVDKYGELDFEDEMDISFPVVEALRRGQIKVAKHILHTHEMTHEMPVRLLSSYITSIGNDVLPYDLDNMKFLLNKWNNKWPNLPAIFLDYGLEACYFSPDYVPLTDGMVLGLEFILKSSKDYDLFYHLSVANLRAIYYSCRYTLRPTSRSQNSPNENMQKRAFKMLKAFKKYEQYLPFKVKLS